jgi:hypothetical protein
MPSIDQPEILKRAEKIKEYHKLFPIASERLHINRGRQLMNELLKDIFGDPLTAPGNHYNGDWEMLFTHCGSEALMTAISLQQQIVQQKAIDEQRRKIELGVLRMATQTAAQVKALLLDTAADSLAMKPPGQISPEGLVRRLENDLSKGPTPPEGQQAFTWQITLDQQGVPGLRAWVGYELSVAEYYLATLGKVEDKPDKINFDLRVLQNKIAYLKQVLKHLPE